MIGAVSSVGNPIAPMTPIISMGGFSKEGCLMTEKTSLPVKIAVVLIVSALLAVFVYLVAKMCSSSGLNTIFYLIFIACDMLFLGLILTLPISEWCGGRLMRSVYYPEPFDEPPPEFPLVRAKIADGRYDEALTELGRMLDADPTNHFVVDLITDVLLDEVGDYRKAMLVLERYLQKPERHPDDARMVMKLADAYQETGRPVSTVVELLECEIARFKGTEKNPLLIRLDALKAGGE